ncbi:helix-turn-helix transcriptional regulator [Sulfurospirillum barnesii]|uniref:Putative transcriptional regulator n=1 Tax=Sulfurospirillum barnesii (strain ATCC 700032 / DSM 10660 / SES-3) TaxID=760154 RepID=I3Y0A8_SULBS|nr:WYL domain-containing protein [Sulfurospirillum barnesii]AFL69632.1 putative transcriptional regulator [Sulfurospirillum barnesii SES-3]
MSKQITEHDKIATRLALILQKLVAKERFTIEELCEEFNVNKRTIQRDVNERLAFLPIKKENGYYFAKSFAFGDLSFKDIQAFATLSGIKSLYPALTNEFIVDLLNIKTNQAYLIKSFNHESITNQQKSFETISAWILKHQQISCTYKNKQRVLNPYKLVNINGIWYLGADEDGTFKTFTFSKITKLKFLDTNFSENPEFVELLKKNEVTWFSNNTLEVTLQINSNVSEYFFRRALLPNQKIIEQNDDYLILSTKVSYEDELFSIVKYWLPHIKILQPTDLQTKFEKILEEYLSNNN